MKQHISLQDLNELSEKGKERLRYWLIEHHAEPFFVDAYESDMVPVPQDVVYLPNIGQLIEFLDEHVNEILIDYGGANIAGEQIKWRLEVEDSQYNSNEIVDSLWEPVKDILEQEEK